MNGLLKSFLAILGFIAALIILSALSLFYEWLRRKVNKPKIGFMHFSSKMFSKGDYVCIKNNVMEFDHWTRDGETIDPIAPPIEENKTFSGNLAFKTDGIRYRILYSSSLKECNFIYGKYGLKWASTEGWARVAKEKVLEYMNR